MAVNGGRVVSNRFPYIALRVQVDNRTVEVECLLDTGFDGDIALPVAMLRNDAPDGYLPWTLADGSEVLAPAYDATLQVGPMPAFPGVVIALGSEPLIGRGVSDRFTVTLDHGARIFVDP